MRVIALLLVTPKRSPLLRPRHGIAFPARLPAEHHHPHETSVKNQDYITCRELIDFISDYLDGTLASEARDEFDRHLTVCPSCVTYLESYQRTIALSRSAFADPEGTVDPLIPDEIVRAIMSARSRVG